MLAQTGEIWEMLQKLGGLGGGAAMAFCFVALLRKMLILPREMEAMENYYKARLAEAERQRDEYKTAMAAYLQMVLKSQSVAEHATDAAKALTEKRV